MAGQDCNNKNGEEHQDTSLPQADQSSTDCQEEYQSADYDNTNYTLSGGMLFDVMLYGRKCISVTIAICSWHNGNPY